ncbi:MAG: hypothetical protein DRJ52_07625 [Thermoprotei archaeon]|nr:MAG: hypothetical protein DRJ52_07625 [Thermoprotei archaeon]
MQSKAIVVDHLWKIYTGREKNIVALRDVSFSVSKGEVVGVLGPNGAGKTTLCLILSGLLEPTKGTAYIMGEDVKELKRKACEKYVALYLAEHMRLWNAFIRLPALKYLEAVGAIRCIEGDLKKKAEEALKKVGLWEWRNEWPSRFSAGMKRKLMIAETLMYELPILILDEPTVHLDPASCIEVWDVLKELARSGKTILLTTQNMEEAEYLCDRILLLSKGNIIASGSPHEVKKLMKYEKITVKVSPRSREFVRLLEKIEDIVEVMQVKDVEDGTLAVVRSIKGSVEPSTLVKLAKSAGLKVLLLSYEELSLSDAFRILLKGDKNENKDLA